MELMDGIKTRCSTRGFKPDPVPKDVINRILEAVSNTPSYTNTQPWEVVVVSRKKRDELQNIIFELAKAKAPTNPDLPMPKSWPAENDTRAHESRTKRPQRPPGVPPPSRPTLSDAATRPTVSDSRGSLIHTLRLPRKLCGRGSFGSLLPQAPGRAISGLGAGG